MFPIIHSVSTAQFAEAQPPLHGLRGLGDGGLTVLLPCQASAIDQRVGDYTKHHWLLFAAHRTTRAGKSDPDVPGGCRNDAGRSAASLSIQTSSGGISPQNH